MGCDQHVFEPNVAWTEQTHKVQQTPDGRLLAIWSQKWQLIKVKYSMIELRKDQLVKSEITQSTHLAEHHFCAHQFKGLLHKIYGALLMAGPGSQTAASPGVGAIEEESQDANGRSARQETNGDQRKPWRFATCRGHAHLHGTALSESGGLCQGSSLMLRAATQHLRSCEALTWQQHVGGACHHSQHQQVGATCHVLKIEEVLIDRCLWAWYAGANCIKGNWCK